MSIPVLCLIKKNLYLLTLFREPAWKSLCLCCLPCPTRETYVGNLLGPRCLYPLHWERKTLWSVTQALYQWSVVSEQHTHFHSADFAESVPSGWTLHSSFSPWKLYFILYNQAQSLPSHSSLLWSLERINYSFFFYGFKAFYIIHSYGTDIILDMLNKLTSWLDYQFHEDRDYLWLFFSPIPSIYNSAWSTVDALWLIDE